MSNTDPPPSLTPEGQRALLMKLLQQKAEENRVFPMSLGQQGLWYAYRRNPQSTAFNVFLPSRLRSAIDVMALRKAMNQLVHRHPCLRTTFTDRQGELKQEVHASLAPEFCVQDATSLSLEAIRTKLAEDAMRPFDLEKGPLLRISAYQVASDDWIVLATTHHIVVDFWSLILILKELRELYPSMVLQRRPDLPEAPSNYAQFVREQQEFMSSHLASSMRSYWMETLQGVPPVLEIPTDFERPAAFTGRASVVPLSLNSNLVPKISKLAASQRTTTFAVVQGALQVLIGRYSSQSQFIIGSPFSGRRHQKYESTVGFFVNMLPLKANLEDDPTFELLIRRVGLTLIGALENQDYPFSAIVHDQSPPRDPSRSPLFQVSCTFEKSQMKEESGRAGFLFPVQNSAIDFGGMPHESFYVPQQTCHHDLEFIFEQTETHLHGMLCYCRDLFTEDSAKQLGRNFESLFASLVENPSLPISRVPWPRENIRHSPDHPCDDDLPSVAEPIPARLERILVENGNHLAIISHGRQWSYRELARLSDLLAQELSEKSIEPGDVVVVTGSLQPEVVLGMLAAWKCGATFVPIDPQKPACSWEDLKNDASPKWILGNSPSVLEWLQGDLSVERIGYPSSIGDVRSATTVRDPFPTKGIDLAYVIYTSGSTGRPKGVMLEHQALANTIAWRREELAVTAQDRFLMVFSHQFDAGLGMIFAALSAGASLHWIEADAILDVDRMIDQILRDKISILSLVPSHLRLLASHRRFRECITLKQIWVGGEAMPRDLPSLVRSSLDVTLWNLYGPTEAAIEATAYNATQHPSERTVPIGRAIANTTVSILDDSLHEVPDFVPGQIAIAGRGLARGYLNHQDLTEQKFVRAEIGGTTERIYLTGDRGRRIPSGEIEFLGRVDHQVKLRGFRIELGEIEAIMRLHPLVQSVAVQVLDADTSHAKLVAYLTTHSELPKGELISQLKRFLSERLPSHKQPSNILILESMPILPSGKIDRNRLPKHCETLAEESISRAPSNPFEAYLVAQWKQILGAEQVGTNQNFFELGGNSLQAAMLTAQLSEDLGLHVPTALLFDLADIAQVAHRVANLHEEAIAKRFGSESVNAYRQPIHGPSATHHLKSVDEIQYHSLIAALKPTGTQKPLFLIHPPGGIVACYRELAQRFDADRPLFAIRSRGLHGEESLPSTLQHMAADYLEAIRSIQPHGPYLLGGWSLGGVIAFEMAQQLLARNEEVLQLFLFDTAIPEGSTDLVPDADSHQVGLEYGIDMSLEQLSHLRADEQLPFLWQHAKNLGVLRDDAPPELVARVLEELRALFHHHVELTSKYRIAPYPSKLTLFRPKDVPFDVQVVEDRNWGKIASEVEVKFVSGHHHSMVQEPHVHELALGIQDCLNRSQC